MKTLASWQGGLDTWRLSGCSRTERRAAETALQPATDDTSNQTQNSRERTRVEEFISALVQPPFSLATSCPTEPRQFAMGWTRRSSDRKRASVSPVRWKSALVVKGLPWCEFGVPHGMWREPPENGMVGCETSIRKAEDATHDISFEFPTVDANTLQDLLDLHNETWQTDASAWVMGHENVSRRTWMEDWTG